MTIGKIIASQREKLNEKLSTTLEYLMIQIVWQRWNLYHGYYDQTVQSCTKVFFYLMKEI